MAVKAYLCKKFPGYKISRENVKFVEGLFVTAKGVQQEAVESNDGYGAYIQLLGEGEECEAILQNHYRLADGEKRQVLATMLEGLKVALPEGEEGSAPTPDKIAGTEEGGVITGSRGSRSGKGK